MGANTWKYIYLNSGQKKKEKKDELPSQSFKYQCACFQSRSYFSTNATHSLSKSRYGANTEYITNCFVHTGAVQQLNHFQKHSVMSGKKKQKKHLQLQWAREGRELQEEMLSFQLCTAHNDCNTGVSQMLTVQQQR